MGEFGEVKDILVLGFLKDGLVMRNRSLVEQQKQVVMALLANRHDIKARRQAYRIFVTLEKAISSDYRSPTFKYQQSSYRGQSYLKQHADDLAYGRRHRRVSQKVFQYLKSRMHLGKERY